MKKPINKQKFFLLKQEYQWGNCGASFNGNIGKRYFKTIGKEKVNGFLKAKITSTLEIGFSRSK
jgi:hypothetical protein